MKSVSQTGSALLFVKKQTEEICKIAVSQNGVALLHVLCQTDEICKLAVSEYWHAFNYVDNKTRPNMLFCFAIINFLIKYNIHFVSFRLVDNVICFIFNFCVLSLFLYLSIHNLSLRIWFIKTCTNIFIIYYTINYVFI